jgi:hypothetical protein
MSGRRFSCSPLSKVEVSSPFLSSPVTLSSPLSSPVKISGNHMSSPQDSCPSSSDVPKAGASPCAKVVSLCISVDSHLHLDDLKTAAKNAKAVHSHLESSAALRCRSTLIKSEKVTGTVQQLLKCIQAHAQDPLLHENPPDVFLLYFAGYGVQQGQKVYLLPGSASPKGAEDYNSQCICLDKVLNILRKDLDSPVQVRVRKCIIFFLVLDLVRIRCVAPGARTGELACELNATAPAKTAILYSSRNKAASLHSNAEHSPLVSALLDPQRGLFVAQTRLRNALSSVSSMLSRKGRHQVDALAVGLDSLPPDFCLLQTSEDSPPDAAKYVSLLYLSIYFYLFSVDVSVSSCLYFYFTTTDLQFAERGRLAQEGGRYSKQTKEAQVRAASRALQASRLMQCRLRHSLGASKI